MTAAHALPPASRFGPDDGSADPSLAAALAAHQQAAQQQAGSGVRGPSGDLAAVQAALLTSRVLVPLVTTGSPWSEHASELATVTVSGRDGRRALPVFTCVRALTAWDPRARPVPTSAVEAAGAALTDGAVALLIDPAGPVSAVLTGPAVRALAQGRRWLPPAQDPEVLAAIRAALGPLAAPGGTGPGVRTGPDPVQITRSADADLAITLRVPAATAQRVRALAQVAADRLAQVDVLRDRLELGLDLAVVPGDPC